MVWWMCHGGHPHSKGGASIGGVPKRTIHNMTDGKSFLEEELFVKMDEELGIDVLAGALIHILLIQDMLLLTSSAVHSVMLILAQLKVDDAGEAIADVVSKQVNMVLESTVQRAADSLRSIAETTVAEFRTALLAVRVHLQSPISSSTP